MKRKSWLVAATAAVAFLSLSAAVGQSNNDTNTNTNTYQQLNLFGDVFEKIRSDYVEPVSDEKLVEAAINGDRKSTRLNSSHSSISYAVFCLKKKKQSQPYPTGDYLLPVPYHL